MGMCRGIGVHMHHLDQTGDRVSIKVGITIRLGIVNVTLIHGDEMFKDQMKPHKLTKAISVHEKEDTITELIYWVKNNLEDDSVGTFTQGRFADVNSFISALQEVYQWLCVEGINGNTSDYLLIIAGDKKNKVYLSHIAPLDKDKVQMITDRIGMDVKAINEDSSKLDWRKDVGI
jgi:hypothetical protein